MPLDPFATLGLPRRFDLDPQEIDRAYLARAFHAHPDALADGASPPDNAETQSALNEARDALLSPERRANELLGLLGGPTKEQDKSLPPGFLIEIMALREEMDAAMPGADLAALASWRSRGEAERARWMSDVAARFARIERGGASPESLRAIRTALNAWRYVERMLEQLEHPREPLP